MLDLDQSITQAEFADLVGTSQQAISKHFSSGVLGAEQTCRQWLLAYCERLREEAAGRVQSDARERRDQAQALESTLNAQMKLRDMLKQDGLLFDRDSVMHMFIELANTSKNELARAVKEVVSGIESKHGITVEREVPDGAIATACRAIASNAEKFGVGAPDDSKPLDTAA